VNAKSAPRGVYLVAEVGGEIVAAVPLDARTAMLHDPSHPTADIRELLRRWARSLRREASMVDSKAA
jgi:hypothetical protein